MIAFDVPPPAIVHAAEPWETRLDAELARRGTPASIRIAVIRELRRLQGIREEFLRPATLAPALLDLARFAGNAALASSFMPGLRVFRSATGADASAAFTANAASATTSIAYSFSSLSLGAEAADRYIIVGTAGQAGSATTLNFATIGGVSAPEIFTVASATTRISFCIAAVPTGATGDVFVQWSAQRTRCAVIVWRITGLLSTTPVDTGSETVSGSNPLNDDVDISAGGVCVAMAYDGSTNNRTWTWSGLAEDVDTTFAGGRSYTGASANFAAAQSGFTVQATPSSSTSQNVFGVVSMR